MPLSIKLKFLSQKYNIIHNNHSITIDSTQLSCNDFMSKLPTCDFPQYFKIKNLFFTDQLIDLNSDNLNFPIIFTDSSKMPAGTSAAFTVFVGKAFIHDYKIRLRKLNSIYQAELVAIKYAIDWMVNSSFIFSKIYTDNQASVLALQNLFPTNSILKDIYNLLLQFPHKRLEIGWIKAHAGHLGNERADQLAKSVITNNNYNIHIYTLSSIYSYYSSKEACPFRMAGLLAHKL